jgi:CBS domain-containing protein
MRVSEVMSSAKCCSPDDTVRDCARLMKEENIGFLPVCDAAGKPVGAITDRDLAIRVLAEGRPASEKIQPFITKDIVECRLDDDISDAQHLMEEQQVSRVMVCDESGKLAGVISLHDLAEAEGEESAGRTLTGVKSDQPTAH